MGRGGGEYEQLGPQVQLEVPEQLHSPAILDVR